MGKSIRGIFYAGLALMAVSSGGELRAQGTPSGFSIQKNQVLGAKHCDVVSWTDANGKARTVWLVRADGDPGYSGGYVDQYTYFIDNTMKTGKTDATQPFVGGLGCAVNHHNSGASSSKANSTGATTGFVFEGANHCVWRFSTPNYSGDGHSAKLTIDWVICQGRNDILWVVSYDTTGQPDFGANGWDARGPYFQFDWDGDGQFYNGTVSGIKWGDKYKFFTTNYAQATAPYTSWDYTQLCPAPYMSLYKDTALGNVESGVVQTQPWSQQDAGGYWWMANNWGKTGTNMPENWNCPFQLNGYEGIAPGEADPFKQVRGYVGEKMAWGAMFGFVGSLQYDRPDYLAKLVGAPHQGYSTYIILNKYTDHLTDAMVNSMGTVQATTLTATTGTVVTSGPRYANLTGNANYQPAGWNHVYGTWAITAGAGNATAFNVNVGGGGTLIRPTFVIGNYTSATAPATVTLGGTTLVSGTDYSASVDATGQKLWLTVNRNLTGAANAFATSSAAASPDPTPTPTTPPTTTPASGDGGNDKKCGCGSASDPSACSALAFLAGLSLLLPNLRSRNRLSGF